METKVVKKFIVLEGLDGAGTTTQLHKISEELTNSGNNVFKTFEPTDNPIGKLIRSVLKKQVVLEPKSISKLFVADRHEHIYGKNGILHNIELGNYVISDRFLFSSLAYQSPECGFDFVYNINKDFPLPEHLIFISTPVEICQERISSRGLEIELFEKYEYQRKVDSFYKIALDKYKNCGIKISIIDGTKTPENITKEIMNIIR